MHTTPAEAISLLNKIKWANTQPDERLKILEKIQKNLMEELEDLGVEEAEMKNMRVGTTDNLYEADATRLTAVVPMAFVISNAIELYRLNLAGKPMDPVRVTKVKDTAFLLNFGGGGGGTGTADTLSENGDEEMITAAEETSAGKQEEDEGEAAADVNEQEGKIEAKEDDVDIQDGEIEAAKTEEAETVADTDPNAKEEEAEATELVAGESEEATTEKKDDDSEPTDEKMNEATPEPDEVDKESASTEATGDDMPEQPSSPPSQAPSEDPPEPPSDIPLTPPSDSPPEPPSDPPPEPPAMPPPEPPRENGADEEEDKENGAKNEEDKPVENGEKNDSVDDEVRGDSGKSQSDEEIEVEGENRKTDEIREDSKRRNSNEPGAENPETTSEHNDANAKKEDDQPSSDSDTAAEAEEKPAAEDTVGAEPATPEEQQPQQDENNIDGTIKIMFAPGDEFAKLAEDDYVPYHDILVSPRTWNEKGYFNGRQERLRVADDPEHRVGPYDRRDPQATAILGASCFSAAAEIIKATFLDGHVAVYKPHPYNAEVDRIWPEIMKPLVEAGALSYCLADKGPELVQDPRIDQIYMTGSAETAAIIQEQTGHSKPCVFQTGSVNPVILVPGIERLWKPKEIRHHALQIASAAKFNGGHFCGRPQVIITSREWSQRDEFLRELKKAVAERTPPEASYDPKYRKVFERFVQEYPKGKVIQPADLSTEWAKMLVVTGAAIDSYGLQHEAFCQVLIEVPLNAPDHPVAFLPEAVKFCNEKLYGALCATIVVDDFTNKQYGGIVNQALNDLQYGTVSTNAMACFGWFNPSLYWGSHRKKGGDGKEKGVGHFGNLLGYEHAVKSVITDSFVGSGHWIKTCRGAYGEKIASLSYYALEPTMKKVTALKVKGVKAAAARKDW